MDQIQPSSCLSACYLLPMNDFHILKCFLKRKKHFMTCENYMKFQFQFSQSFTGTQSLPFTYIFKFLDGNLFAKELCSWERILGTTVHIEIENRIAISYISISCTLDLHIFLRPKYHICSSFHFLWRWFYVSPKFPSESRRIHI